MVLGSAVVRLRALHLRGLSLRRCALNLGRSRTALRRRERRLDAMVVVLDERTSFDGPEGQAWLHLLVVVLLLVVAPAIEALVLMPPGEGAAKERVGKVGRAKTTVRPLAIDRLNALLLGAR